jgi:hypothetical protein
MAQPPSPSLSLLEGSAENQQPNHANHVKSPSNPDVPIDPSISQASPTYPPYSPYPQDQGMHQGYQAQHPGYMPPRPGPHEQWGGYPPQHGMPGPYGQHPGGVQGPPPTTAGARPGQVRFISSPNFEFVLTRRRCTASFRSPVLSSTSDRDGDTKKSSACTSADGMGAKRHMEH